MLRLTTLGGLWIDGSAKPAGEVRPRRLALLAILAAAGAKGVTRDQVLGILWSESEPERARHSLSQTLYSLRRDLGVEVVLHTPTLRLDPGKITSDLDEFRAATSSKDWECAATLFAGAFLDGFFLSDAPDFERWAEEERSMLLHDALHALEAAVDQAEAGGKSDQAEDLLRRLAKLDPLNGRTAARYIEALSGAGERAKALVYAQSHIELVRTELDVEPDVAVVRLLEGLRDTGVIAARLRTSPPNRQTTPIAPAIGIVPSRERVARMPSRHRRLAVVGAVALLIGSVLVAQLMRKPASASTAHDGTGLAKSALAARLYSDGLHAFYQFDADAARRLFNAAIGEDSSFAMAAYFAWRSEAMANGPRQDALAARARALAAHAPDRDRLLIMAHLGASRWDLAAIATSESLATRFPNDAEALIRAADVANDLPGALTLLDRAIALDSTSAKDPAAICRACDAFNLLARRYDWADSSRRVEETLNRWSALRPADYQPWRVRADYLMGLGRVRDADAAQRHADSLGAPRGDSVEASLGRALRTDELEAAMAICRSRLAGADPDQFVRYRSLCTIGLRMEGRDRDALVLSQEARLPWTNVVRHGVAPDRVHGAILDMEMRRPLAAAIAFTNMAAEAAHSVLPEGLMAGTVAWDLTLSATASALAGDTVRVRSLVDSVELIGHRSLVARDPLLHHFLRGLLLAQAGQHEGAVREFRAAIWSPSQGYTRINYEIGKSLLALNRAPEAIPILRAALRGSVEGSGLYLTRTETHELLARAFDNAGQRDSAAVHYAVVERAWRSADPLFVVRYDTARQWLLRAGHSVR